MEGWGGDIWDERNPSASNDTIERQSVSVSVDRTFTFDNLQVRQILADYLRREQKVDVKVSDFNFDIDDSVTGGHFYDGPSRPARLNNISVVVRGNGK